MNIEKIFADTKAVVEVTSNLGAQTRQLVTGLLEPAKQLFLNALLQKQNQPILVVTDSLAHAERLYNELAAFRVVVSHVHHSVLGFFGIN
ncbi:hypothetical protein ODR38_03760 [Pediococcus acidilactici]